MPHDLPPDRLVHADRDFEAALISEADADLERLTKAISPERIEKRLSQFASPWVGICRSAREHEAELIVIGSHGYGGLDRVLGTTAAKVVNHADRNVLVVRTPL